MGDKNPELALPPDREKVLTSELTLLQMKVDPEAMALLSEVKSLLSHQIVDGNFNELMKYMAQAAIAQIKKKKGLSVKKEKVTERKSKTEIDVEKVMKQSKLRKPMYLRKQLLINPQITVKMSNQVQN